MEKKTMVIAGQRYSFNEKEAEAVRLVREAYGLKCVMDNMKKRYEQKRKELITLMKGRLREKKSVEINAVDIVARLELQQRREFDQGELERIAREYGATFWEYFKSRVIYIPRDKLKLLLRGKLPEKMTALAQEIRMAEEIKMIPPKLRFIEPE